MRISIYVRSIPVALLVGAVLAVCVPVSADIMVSTQQADARRAHPDRFTWQETLQQSVHTQGAEEFRRDPNVERWLRSIAWPLCDQDETQMRE